MPTRLQEIHYTPGEVTGVPREQPDEMRRNISFVVHMETPDHKGEVQHCEEFEGLPKDVFVLMNYCTDMRSIAGKVRVRREGNTLVATGNVMEKYLDGFPGVTYLRTSTGLKLMAIGISAQYDGYMKSIADQLQDRSHLKLAFVTVASNRVMVYAHNESMKAFAIVPYKPGDKEYYVLQEPLQEVEYEKFDRWCTGHDV